VPSRHQGSILHRAVGAAVTGLLLAQVLLPAAALAAPGGPPKPTADTITTTEGVPASGNVLDNDTNLGGGTLTVVGQGALSSSVGTLVIAANGDYTFTPAPDWFGTATTTYDVANDKHTKTGTITINVSNVEDGPTANDDTVTVDEDAPTDVTSQLLGNDTDPDDDTLTVTSVSNESGGDADLTGTTVTFTAPADVCGTGLASFDYTISDGNGGTDDAHAVVDISCQNDNPVAVDDTASGTEDTDVTITASDLATNDTDVENDSLTVTGVADPDGGSVSLDSGTITFVPTADLCGDDAAGFDYTVEDGNGGSDTGTVRIDLDCTNDAPIANDDTASVQTNSAAADHDVLANDTDVDAGHTLTVQTAVVDPSQGTASVVANKVRFAPANGFEGEAVITYTMSDGTLTDSATLTITVSGDVAGPVVAAATVAFGSGRVDETAPLKISWSATDVPSGVAKYEVQVSVAGGAFQPVYTGTGTSVTKFYPFKKLLVFRVRAQDTVGNWSGWVTSAGRKIVAFQESNKHVAYSGAWSRVKSSKSSGTGYSFTTTKDKKARLTFSGRSVMYVAPKTPSSGKVKVYLDGTLLGTYDLKVASTRLGRIITTASWSGWSSHTIRIVANSSAKTGLDAFIVLK
jgi:hypothetical protein